jgi:sister-chromatid-cohesion protein PDS5
MNLIVRQASLRILNQSSIPTLLKRLQKPSHPWSENAGKMLRFVSKHIPALYQSHVGELIKGVADEKHELVVELSLQALAAVVRWDEKVAPTDKCVYLHTSCFSFGAEVGLRRTLERVKRLALEGTHRQAKFAARFLAFSKSKATVCTQVVEVLFCLLTGNVSHLSLQVICDAMDTSLPEVLVAHTAVLAQFARFAPDAFEHKSDVLMAFLLKELLMVPTHPLDVRPLSPPPFSPRFSPPSF